MLQSRCLTTMRPLSPRTFQRYLWNPQATKCQEMGSHASPSKATMIWWVRPLCSDVPCGPVSNLNLPATFQILHRELDLQHTLVSRDAAQGSAPHKTLTQRGGGVEYNIGQLCIQVVFALKMIYTLIQAQGTICTKTWSYFNVKRLILSLAILLFKTQTD